MAVRQKTHDGDAIGQDLSIDDQSGNFTAGVERLDLCGAGIAFDLIISQAQFFKRPNNA